MLKRLLFIVIVGLGALGFWTRHDRVGDDVQVFDARLALTETFGADHGKGNLLGIQPWMVPSDYANSATLEAKLASYLDSAKAKGWLNEKTVVILPEYMGTWLVAAGEKRSAYAARETVAAMQTLVMSHLPAFAYRFVTAPTVGDRAKWAIFTMKSEQAARDYQSVFGNLAKRFGVHLVAGSIVLAEPALRDGRLITTPGGRLFNISALFNPKGDIIAPLVVKAFPIADELTFSSSGEVAQLPVFMTPAGRLSILICADSWYPASYDAIKGAGPELMAVPSYSAGDGLWATPWAGYNGANMPADIVRDDVRKITEGEAWLKYAMAGRAQDTGIRAGLNVFLRGELWDLGSDGATLRVSRDGSHRGAMVRGAALTNLWLN